MTIQTIPPTRYEVAFNANPNQSALPPYWSDISSRVVYPWDAERGREYDLDANETGMWRAGLSNADGALDPGNAASSFAPGVVPYRQARIRCLPGANLLFPDQATAGEGSGYGPGPVPPQTLVTCGAGYPLSYAASGSAAQGTQVYQVAVPSGAAQPKDLLDVSFVDALPGTVYSAQLRARALATAQNLTVSVAIDWCSPAAAVISTTTGSGVALAGGSTTWIQLTASGPAPTGTEYCRIRAVLGTTTTATASVQFDGLQFEAGPFPTAFQIPNTLSANLFPRNIATCGQALGTASGSWTPTGGTPPFSGTGTAAFVTGLPAAPTGQTSGIAWSPQSIGAASSGWLLLFGGAPAGPCADVVQVAAGTTYTASFYGLRAASADATLAVALSVVWYTAAGLPVSVSTGTPVTLAAGAWNRVTVSAAAPATAAWGRPQLAVTTPATPTDNNTVYLAGAQFEAAATASAWQDPGTAYSVITPYVEEWPETWTDLDGTFGTTAATASDAFVALSQYTLPAPFIAELLALGPNFLFQLDEPLGAAGCADTTGKRPPAPVENSPYGAGSLTFGSPVAAVNLPSGGYLGAPGPVATFNNNTSAGNQLAETFVSLHKTTTAPGPPTTTGWTRMIAFRAPAAPSALDAFQIWCAAPRLATQNSFCEFAILAGGALFLNFIDGPGTGNIGWSSPGSVCDGNWHLAAVGVDPASGSGWAYFDGAVVATAGGIGAPSNIATDVIGCLIQSDIGVYSTGYKGDAAYAAELPFLLSSAQMTNLYASFKTASTGDASGARVNRVLNWIGWTGPTAVDAGLTASMGPATDLTGETALDALNNIALTENGNVYAANSGAITFKARNARYNQLTPLFSFGESQAAGEWPYEGVALGFDAAHVGSDVQVTQYGGPTVTAFSAASRAQFFPRVYTRTINSTSLPECSDAANYLLSQLKSPRQRVSSLVLHPSAVPGLFAVCLALEIGTRIRVTRRPASAPATVFDGFVEHVAWSWDPDSGDVFVTLECSPANLTSYWVLAGLHTTLHAQATAGTNTIGINALPDAAVNKLSQSLPSGYQLTLDPGNPALAETVTIAPGGIPTTSLGYTSATLTLTGNLAHTHASGAIVCEPLPAGVTDPTVYDTASVIGALSTTVALAASAGTNTVTVNALPDAKYNALVTAMPQSQVLWLSPGTAQFEAVTVAPTGIPATYPGWTTAVLTLTGNLAHAHPVGDVVCEPLPGGFTSPSQVLATAIPAY